jgi:hypothetical protein
VLLNYSLSDQEMECILKFRFIFFLEPFHPDMVSGC